MALTVTINTVTLILLAYSALAYVALELANND